MSNIKDVAKAAGVSVSTVSNILNNKAFVSEELHQKVVTAMRELDYHPNFLAMNLRKKKISFIGIICDALNGHYHQIVEGIYRVSKQKNCQPILKLVSSAAEERREIESLIQMSVSGIIVLSSYLDEALLAQYMQANMPVVFADHYPRNCDCNIVCFDNYGIVHALTQELMLRGQQVGLITGSAFLGSESDCRNGYLDALDPAVQQGAILFDTEFNKERAFSGLIQFISALPKMPDCLIVSAAWLAKTVSEICSLLNLSGMRVYALSGDSWYRYRSDSVSYLRRNSIACGTQAAEILFENISESAMFEPQQIVIRSYEETKQLFGAPPLPLPRTNRSRTLRLLLLDSNISRAIRILSRDFTARTGINIDVTTANQQDLMQIIMKNARAKSSEYDIVMADMHWLQMLKQEKVLCELNELLPIAQILPRYVHDVRDYILSEASDEAIYALPILTGYQVLVYRSDLFEDTLLQKKFYLKYGVPLRPPHTWNEFNLVAKFFTRAFHQESPVQYGTCLLGGKPEGIMAEFLPRQWSYHGHFLGQHGLDMVTMANQKAVRNLCESYLYSYPDCMDFLEDEQIRKFAEGDTAMICTYNVHLQDRPDYSKQYVRFARLPGTSSLIGGWLLGINAYSEQIEESAQFLNWEISDRISVHSSLLGQVSPFKSVFYDQELLTIYPWMRIINERGTALRGKEFGTQSFRKDCVGRRLEQTLADNLWRAILKKIPPESVMRLTQDQFPNALF